MMPNALGDLAQALLRRQHINATKTNLNTLGNELATGRMSDLRSHLHGNTGYLSGLESDLSRLKGLSTNATEMAQKLEHTQLRLEHIHTSAKDLSHAALSTTSANDLTVSMDSLAIKARQNMATALSNLNGDLAGQSLFAGTATDSPAVANSDTLFGALNTELTGLTDSTAIKAAVHSWFADPGGFQLVMYLGNPPTNAGVPVGPHDQITQSITANDPALRNVLADMAILALQDQLPLSHDARAALVAQTGPSLLQTLEGIIGLRTQVGAQQERLEQVQTQNAAETISLEIARNALISADPYETATRLTEAETQLELLYTLTARSARLKLVNFLS